MNKLTFDKKARGTLSEATHRKLVNRIDHWMQTATKVEHDSGCAWYAWARIFCHGVASEHGFRAADVARAVAILSPQIDWEQNKLNVTLLAAALSTDIKIFATLDQKTKALSALGGEYHIPMTSRKTHSFADNIADDLSTRVTVDRHAAKVAMNDLTATEVRITNLQYRKIEAAYQEVAAKHGLRPYQVQAICWVTYKRVVGR